MNTRRETLRKNERLSSQKVMTSLLESGNTYYFSFFRVLWSIFPGEASCIPARVAFGVSKKGFRHAVTRNLLKRRMREAYRKNKNVLYDYLGSENLQIALAIIYKDNNVQDYQSIEKAMTGLMEKLTDKISKG